MHTTTRATLAATAIAALALTGCGRLIEKAAEKATGCEKIDLNDKGASAKCKGNSIDLSGGNAKVPDGFPSELKPPSNAKLFAAVKSAEAGEPVTYGLTMIIPGDPGDLAEAFRRQLADARYTIRDDTVTEGSDGMSGSIVARNSTYEAVYLFGAAAESSTATTTAGISGSWVQLNVKELTEAERNEPPPTTSKRTTTTESDGSGSGSGSGSEGSGSSGTSLPEGFPEALAPPSTGKILTATRSTSGGATRFFVSVAFEAPVADVYAGLKTQLTGAGYTIGTDSLTSAAGTSAGVLNAQNESYDVSATISEGTGADSTAVAMVVSPR